MADDIIYNNTQYLGLGEVDSDGDPLPGNFNSIPKHRVMTWTGTSGMIPATMVEDCVIGELTFTRTTVYDNNGVMVTEETPGPWVKS